MGFRLGNVDGRAVLVEGDGVFDVERVSEGRLGPGSSWRRDDPSSSSPTARSPM